MKQELILYTGTVPGDFAVLDSAGVPVPNILGVQHHAFLFPVVTVVPIRLHKISQSLLSLVPCLHLLPLPLVPHFLPCPRHNISLPCSWMVLLMKLVT